MEPSLRRFHFDTLTYDANLLRGLIEYAGADHVVLGSGCPFDKSLERRVECVREAGLSAGDQAMVPGGNAVRLLGSYTKRSPSGG